MRAWLTLYVSMFQIFCNAATLLFWTKDSILYSGRWSQLIPAHKGQLLNFQKCCEPVVKDSHLEN